MKRQPSFRPSRPKSVAAQITEHVRDRITSGELRPGDKLPSSQELAEQWGTHAATVHGALTPLVKEGLISRAPRRGTVVEASERDFECLGVYLHSDVWSEREGAFVRSVYVALEDLMKRRGGRLAPWIDGRPRREQSKPWSELADAARRREVQAVVVLRTDIPHLRWLRKLPVATAFVTDCGFEHSVAFDTAQLARDSVADLARQGSRSVGLISVQRRNATNPGGSTHQDAVFHAAFRDAVKDLGLIVREAWIQAPDRRNIEEERAERYGYDAFAKIWRGRERPDGLFVFTDIVARGALMAAAELGARIPDELKLVLHRNDAVGLFCPHPVSYMDAPVSVIARRLVEMVEAQHRGKDAPSVVVPYALTRAGSKRARRSKGRSL